MMGEEDTEMARASRILDKLLQDREFKEMFIRKLQGLETGQV